ncbi:hypothetical protein [Streptomyces sp. DSM 41269]|nr:hypothetical protein [Streptomyces sp. DSM 41269]
MADMIADYGSDVHQILGKEMDGATDFNQLEIDRGDLTGSSAPQRRIPRRTR